MSSIALWMFYGMCGLALTAFAFYGWGRLTRRATALPRGTWPTTAALGLATVVFVGGILNVLRLARPAAFVLVAVTGLLLAAQALWSDSRSRRSSAAIQSLSAGRWAWWVSSLLIVAFACATQLMPSFYNSGDDLKEYFGHAVRMVETGTLFGSPLNASGAETLGGQAFLQGFIVSFASVRFINAADAIFCLFLSMALAGGVAIGRPALALPALVAAVAVFVIDPQYVNVSSLYSTVVVAATLTLLATDAREGDVQSTLSWRRAAAPALLYTAGVALKSTNIVFLAILFALSAGCSCWTARRWQEGVASYGRVAVLVGIFLSPWLLLYAPYYLAGVLRPLPPPLTAVPSVHERHLWASLILARRMFFGAPELAYTCLAVGLLGCAFLAASRARSHPQNRYELLNLAVATGAAAATYFFWVLYAPLLQELIDTRRYPIPVLIGVASVALPLTLMIHHRSRIYAYAAAAVTLCLFVLPLRDRLGVLVHQRTQLAYLHQWNSATRNREQRFVERALGPEMAEKVHALQSLVPPGERILAWTAAPFLLDYRRNEIIDMNVAGFNQSWGHMVPARYVLWQRDGYGADRPESIRPDLRFGRRTGKFAARALDVYGWFEDVIDQSETIREEDGMTLVRTMDTHPLPPD